MNIGKKWWQSKTIWLGIVVAILALADATKPFIPAQYAGYLALVVAILIIIFRYLTGQPIALKDIVAVAEEIHDVTKGEQVDPSKLPGPQTQEKGPPLA